MIHERSPHDVAGLARTGPRADRARARARRLARPGFEPLEARALLAATGFGHSLQFLPPAQHADLEGQAQPTYTLGNLAQSADLGAPGAGVTLELWVRPTSSGVLVEQPYRFQTSQFGPLDFRQQLQVPLIWVDADGRVEAGLIDRSGGAISVDARFGSALNRSIYFFARPTVPTVSLTTPLGLRTAPDQPFATGAPDAIVGLNSVLNNGWHHVALVATASAQSLYVDGQLQGIRAGDFGLRFDANLQGIRAVAIPDGLARLGGTLQPEVTGPAALSQRPGERDGVASRSKSNLYPRVNYPYGYTGEIDEVRVWNEARPLDLLQGSIATPLKAANRASLPHLRVLDTFDGAMTPTPHMAHPVSTVPVDLFPNVARLPGYRDFGLKLATPLETVQLAATLDARGHFVQKVTLAQGDQIVVSATGQDGIPLTSGRFTLAVNASPRDAAHNRTSTVALNPIVPPSITFTAGETGTYRLDALFDQLPAGVKNVNITYRVAPGPLNNLLELFGSFRAPDGSLVPAYHDPKLPAVSAVDAYGFLNRANWPTLTMIAPPAGAGPSTEPQLIAAYNAIYGASLADGTLLRSKYNLQGGFYDLANSGLSKAGDLDQFAADLGSLQAGAFPTVTADAFNTLKSFLLAVTGLRKKALGVLDGYKDFAANLLTTGALTGVPSSIVQSVVASLQQSNSNQNPPTLTWPESDAQGFDITSAFKQAAIGLAPSLLGTAASVVLPGTGFFFEGIATLGLEALTYAASDEAARPTLTPSVDANAYSKITNVGARVQSDLATTGGNLVASFNDPTMRQAVMSNYGLLTLLANVPSSPFSKQDFDRSSQALAASLRYASWKQIVAAAYHWQPELPVTTQSSNSSSFSTFAVTADPFGAYVATRSGGVQHAVPVNQAGLAGQLIALQGGNAVTQATKNPVTTTDVKITWSPYSLITTYDGVSRKSLTTGQSGSQFTPPLPPNFAKTPDNAVTQGKGSRFYTLAAVNLQETSTHDYTSLDPIYLRLNRTGFAKRTVAYGADGAMGIAWALRDSNGIEMAPDIAQQIFGVGTSPAALTATGEPRYTNEGAYFPTNPAPGAVTTWADAYFNWGLKNDNGAPGSLVPSAPIAGTFTSTNGPFGNRNNASVGAADVNYTVTFKPLRPRA